MKAGRQAVWIPQSYGFSIVAALCGLLGLTGCVSGATDRLAAPAANEQRARAQLDLARGYLENDDPARARGPLLRALELDPVAVEAHVLAGVLYEREQESALAERHYLQALTLAPHDPQALNNYGAFLYGQGRLQAALSPLRRAAQDTAYRLRAQAFENLGLTELGLGRVDAARSAFERALDLNQHQPRSSLELAELLFVERDYIGAERRYHDFLVQAGETWRGICLGLRLAGIAGASERSAHHAALLRSRYPEAMQKCR